MWLKICSVYWLALETCLSSMLSSTSFLELYVGETLDSDQAHWRVAQASLYIRRKTAETAVIHVSTGVTSP